MKTTNIFEVAKEANAAAKKVLAAAKKLEEIKIIDGYKYVTSPDGKTSKLVKL